MYYSSMVGATGSYQFKINYSQTKNLKIGQCLTLPNFRVGRHRWLIKYYPQGDDEDYRGKYVSVFLQLINELTDVTANFGLAPLDKYGNISSTTMSNSSHTFTSAFTSRNRIWGTSRFLERTILEEKYIEDDCFVLNVSITITDGPYHDPCTLLGHSQTIRNFKFLHERIQKFREENQQTDVTFIVDGENFVAHKLILTAHSPVLGAELCGLMAESNMDCIMIKEMMPSVFKAMLDFMYNGSIPANEELSADEQVMFVQNLLVAADRYAVEILISICEDKLVESISLDNVLSLLELAERHNCSDLKSECLEFILDIDNSVSLMVSEEYIKLVQRRPSLLAELKKMANK